MHSISPLNCGIYAYIWDIELKYESCSCLSKSRHKIRFGCTSNCGLQQHLSNVQPVCTCVHLLATPISSLSSPYTGQNEAQVITLETHKASTNACNVYGSHIHMLINSLY